MFAESSGADTTYASGSFSGRLSIKLPSLGALNLGYTNPALANGLAGCILNPAALSEVKDKSFSTVVGFGSEVRISQKPVFDIEEFGEVAIPLDFAFAQPVSMNTITFGANFGGWVFGLGFIEEFGVKLNSSGDVTFGHTFNDTIYDTLTSADIPEIPVGDTIPVAFSFRSPVELSLAGDGNLNYSENRFFLGIARQSSGRFKMGAGIKYRPIRGKVLLGSVANANAPCTLECQTTQVGWTINGIGTTHINEDVLYAGWEGKVTGNELGFIGGMILDLGLLKLSGTLEGTSATTLKIEGGSELTYITGIPSIDSIYVDSVEVDTVNNVLSGTMGVKLSDFPDTTEMDNWEDENYELEGKIGVTLGTAIKLGPFTTGLAVGANTLDEFWLSGGFESRLLFPLRTNFELRNKVYQINGEQVLFPPYMVMGIGSSVRIKKLGIDFGLKTNSFHTLASIAETIEEEQLPGLFELFSPVIGINLKFE